MLGLGAIAFFRSGTTFPSYTRVDVCTYVGIYAQWPDHSCGKAAGKFNNIRNNTKQCLRPRPSKRGSVSHACHVHLPPTTTQISCRSAPSSYGPARVSMFSPRSLNIFGCCGGTFGGEITVWMCGFLVYFGVISCGGVGLLKWARNNLPHIMRYWCPTWPDDCIIS